MAEISTIPAYILANENLLFWMLRVPLRSRFETNEKKRNLLREYAYVDFHRWNSNRPDHVFRHRWNNFYEKYLTQSNKPYGIVFSHFSAHHQTCSVVLAALKCLADEYIEIREQTMHVRLDKFGWWQNLLSRLSALPLQALMRWLMKREGLISSIPDDYGLPPQKNDTLILYPYDSGVENYINRCGINDSHVHINLCAYAEECWLNALCNPEDEWRKQQEQYDRNSDVAELYREIHVNLTPKLLWHDHMNIACRLRYLLISYANDVEIPLTRNKNKKGKDKYLPVDFYLNKLADKAPELWQDKDVPISSGSPSETHNHDVTKPPDVFEELDWMEKLVRKLSLAPNELIDRAFHLYILLMNEFLTFCVQRDNLFGFKQFQKYSSIRTTIVDRQYYYYRVFERMHGNSSDSMTNYMELRVAPSLNEKDTANAIQSILNGYWQYARQHLRQQQPDFSHSKSSLEDILEELNELFSSTTKQLRIVRPAIVLHLIKRAWEDSENSIRFGRLREEYSMALDSILKLLQDYPELRQWIRGIDAAADEMDTPPDVFAPAYRKARRQLHIPHATYHAGEDFYHLISGIRTVCEAVNILGLQRGDRIGHATALGISPNLWLSTMPAMVTPTRGEWLQDLVFTWDLLQGIHDHPELVQRLNVDIREHGYAVFRRSHLSPYILKRVFDLRRLDPEVLVATEDLARNMMLKKSDHPITMEDIVNLLETPPEHIGAHDIEKQLVYEAFANEAPEVIGLITNWQGGKKTKRRSEERIEVPSDYFSMSELLLIQQLALRKLVEKAIVLETLPTSNLRIGQYSEMGQHHSLRWMGVDRKEGDIVPLLVLGSDDPGVFATNIKAEFYHLYAALRSRGLNSQQALEKLIRIDESGSRYAFRSLSGNAVK